MGPGGSGGGLDGGGEERVGGLEATLGLSSSFRGITEGAEGCDNVASAAERVVRRRRSAVLSTSPSSALSL